MNNDIPLKRENYTQVVKRAILKVWTKDIKSDYNKHLLLKEDTLKNAFYYHLRKRLGDTFLNKNNLAIFTEFFIVGERIDLVVVEIDPLKAKSNYLGECVINILAVVEMKYKGANVQDGIFQADVDKIMNYLINNEKETLFYLAFIREVWFHEDEIDYWLIPEQQIVAKDRVTELLAYHSIEQEKMIWLAIEH
ncbi:hypothetical protein [Psychrobacillus sp. FJAT-21963]|uniref:hypothetical protein n=1 Tax=Psychrobacillus sp. FJAT-21963 TaxID=1712028 RepID=UPI0020A1BE88|nr:hypothetical protein [Psychrobacillus sp. FJAT-21963]